MRRLCLCLDVRDRAESTVGGSAGQSVAEENGKERDMKYIEKQMVFVNG